MKTFGIYLSLFSCLFLSGCFLSRDYLVEYDYNYHSDFQKYKTFDFMVHYNQDTVTAQNSALLEEAIRFRMELLGYQYQPNNPDLMIIYKIFFKDFKFRGYEQPNFRQWVKYPDSTETYDPVKYGLKNGTLLIHLIDRKRRNTVWLGYAAGIKSATNTAMKRTLKHAVISIFDRYEVFALKGADPYGDLAE